jgi:dTDP-L-rhamnose 4-epimerase
VRVLVTGGSGFIGSHVVDALVERGHDVISLDAHVPGAHLGRPGYLRADVEHREADLRNIEAVRSAARGVDAVCHQAAKVGLGVDLGDVDDYVSHNDLGTAMLLRALHERRFRGPIALASSMVVYGEGQYRCRTHGVVRPGPRRVEDLRAGRYEHACPTCAEAVVAEAIGEDSHLDPRSVYAATKLHQEHLCRAYAVERGSPVAALRYHNVYGPRMARDTPYAGVAGIFRSALERGEPPIVLEDGLQRRNFIHVTDVAAANVLALEAAADGAFNIASDAPRTVGEMAEALARAFGAGAPRPRVVGGSRPGDVRHVFASPSKAARELGFRSTVGFDDGMREFARAPLRGSQIVASRTPAATSPSTSAATASR